MMKLTFFLTFRRVLSVLMTIVFVMSSVVPSYAQTAVNLPEPGKMLALSPAAAPAMLRGFTIDPQDPFSFEFLMDRGQAVLTDDAKKAEYQKQIKYFLASLAIPEKDLWVNLSPYENDRIIADNFGLTAMGRDLLAQDYILKQITASLIHPDSELGKTFWEKVYKAAADKYGTTNIPVDTFNKVWIMPEQAEVYANGLSVLLVKSHLKVMLDADRTAEKAAGQAPSSDISQEVMRDVVLPILEKEVNEGANFASVRQITSALILATWYKKQWQERLLNTVYSDRSKVKGVDQDPANNAQIYQKYVEAFKQGVFNFIKEEVDAYSQEPVPRKYFSGGYTTKDDAQKPLSERITRLSALPSGVDFSQSDSVHSRFNFFHPFKSRSASDGHVDAQFKKAYWPLIEQDALNRGRTIDPEAAKAPLKVGAMFTDYFRKHLGNLVLKWDHPALYDLLKDKQLDGDDAFDVIVNAVKEKVTPLYAALDHGRVLPDDVEAQLEALTFQMISFMQNVLMSSSLFNTKMSSVLDLLEGRGWNSSSLSMMTVLLADIAGLRGVSMVEIDADEQGIKYPLFYVYHFATMIRVGAKHFILDQGRQAVPLSVMVVTDYNRPSPAELEELDHGFGLKWSGLDAERLKQHVQALRNLKDMEKEIDRTLTEKLSRTNPERYKAMNEKWHYDFQREMQRNPSIYWLHSSYDKITDMLTTKLDPRHWDKKTWSADIKEHQGFLRDLNEFLEMAAHAYNLASQRQDVVMFRRAAYRYRLAAEMGDMHLGPWRAALEKRKSGLKDKESYLQWVEESDDADVLKGIVTASQARANLLDINVRIYAARDEIQRVLNKARQMKQEDPHEALRVLADLDQRIDLFIVFFEVAYREDQYRSHTPFKDVVGPFYQVKEIIASEEEEVWNSLLDTYNTLKAGGNVDNGQAPDVVGGIDLDPSKFDIKTRGAIDALFAQVPAADAVQIEGLLPQILSITPGEGFLKRFALK